MVKQLLFRIIVVAYGLAACAVTLFGQSTGTPSSKLNWDQQAPDLATAQAYTYSSYPDAVTTPTVVVGTCSGTAAPFACNTPFPAFTPGPHTLALSAKSVAGESTKSTTLTFTFVIIPNAPINLRIGGDELEDADFVAWGITVTSSEDRP